MQVMADEQVREYFRNVQQVFLYVTDECNLRCEQCLYKPLLASGRAMRYEVAVGLLDWVRSMGAVKLSLIGGEPTRYASLGQLVHHAKDSGYEYVRMDTNGQFASELLEDAGMRRLDELSFSLDGHTAEIDEALRGRGSFARCVENIRRAVDAGYRVDITCCVHRGNCDRRTSRRLLIEEMIEFAVGLGVAQINFHPLFRMGIPRDTWAGETDISPEIWMSIYRSVRDRADQRCYPILVRVPQRFVTEEEFGRNAAGYGYCPVKLGERILIHPNGEIRVCALMIGTPYAVAGWAADREQIQVSWNSESNEITENGFDMGALSPCTNQKRDFGGLVPLCISFKPKQDEFVWKRMGRP